MKELKSKPTLTWLLFVVLGFNLSWTQGWLLSPQDIYGQKSLSSTGGLVVAKAPGKIGLNYLGQIKKMMGEESPNDVLEKMSRKEKHFELKINSTDEDGEDQIIKYNVTQAQIVKLTDSEVETLKSSFNTDAGNWWDDEDEKNKPSGGKVDKKKTKYLFVMVEGRGAGDIEFDPSSDAEGKICLDCLDHYSDSSNKYKHNKKPMLIPLNNKTYLPDYFAKLQVELNGQLDERKKKQKEELAKKEKDMNEKMEKVLNCDLDASFKKYKSNLNREQQLTACLKNLGKIEFESDEMEEKYKEKQIKAIQTVLGELNTVLQGFVHTKSRSAILHSKEIRDILTKMEVEGLNSTLRDEKTALRSLETRAKYSSRLQNMAQDLKRLPPYHPLKNQLARQIEEDSYRLQREQKSIFSNITKNNIDDYSLFSEYEIRQMAQLNDGYQSAFCASNSWAGFSMDCANVPSLDQALRNLKSDGVASNDFNSRFGSYGNDNSGFSQQPYGINQTLTGDMNQNRGSYLGQAPSGFSLNTNYSAFSPSTSTGMNNNTNMNRPPIPGRPPQMTQNPYLGGPSTPPYFPNNNFSGGGFNNAPLPPINGNLRPTSLSNAQRFNRQQMRY